MKIKVLSIDLGKTGPPPLKWSSAMFRKRRKTMANKRPKPEEIVTKLRERCHDPHIQPRLRRMG